MIKENVPSQCDALVIGSGAAGLVAALTLKDSRPAWSVWVVEQSQSVGGTTAYSGGVCWIPGNRWKEDPERDLEEARRYVKGAFPEVDERCLDSFLADAPRVLDFMISKGVKMEGFPEYPDYYQEIDGASTGRSVSPQVYKGPKKIRKFIRKVPYFYPPFTLKEAEEWGLHRLLHWNKTLLAKRKVAGHLTLGPGFIGFLLDACMEAGVDLALGCKTDGLLIQGQQITGVTVKGRKVSAPVVIMACGGFSHNQELMRRIKAVRPVLSVASEECDNGGGLSLALDAGLEVGNPYCWWVPIMKLYGEDEEKPGPDIWAYHPTLHDRCWPGGIMVNAQGRRFTNESACYNTVGGILAMDPDPHLDRVWLIWGEYYVKNYIRGTTSWLHPAKSYMNKSGSLEELAGKIGVPASNLKDTVGRWNEMAARGRDEEFHRGESLYDRFMGDRFRDGHPNIGPVEAPFQAVRVHPGCLSTKMGPVNDEFGRVQLEDGRKVSGLYAAGNAGASFLGNIYPGAGGTLGPAVVFGYRAARHACG